MEEQRNFPMNYVYLITKLHYFIISFHTNYVFVAESTAASSPSGAPSDNTLPVVFEATEDPTLNNLSRTDVNCDKTGTCYDGKFQLPKIFYYFNLLYVNFMVNITGHLEIDFPTNFN